MGPLGEPCVTVQIEVHPLKEMIPVRDAITASLNDLDFIVKSLDESARAAVNKIVGDFFPMIV